MTTLGIWMAALGTLTVLSYLYKDSLAFRVCEHILVGLQAAILLVQGYESVVSRAWTPLVSKGEYIWLVPILLGVLLYTRLFRQTAWISRIPMGFILGIGAAVSLWRALGTEVIAQVAATCAMTWSSPVRVFYVLCTILTIGSFVFVTSKGTRYGTAVTGVAFLGRCVLMIAFGAGFGNTVMSRIAPVVARLRFLLVDWLRIAQ
jgi:hypothetical protein